MGDDSGHDPGLPADLSLLGGAHCGHVAQTINQLPTNVKGFILYLQLNDIYHITRVNPVQVDR